MSKQDVHQYIRERKRNTRSIDDQVKIAHTMWERNTGPDHEGLKAKEIEAQFHDLGYKAKTSLGHLEEVDMVEEFTPSGPDVLAIAEWMNNGDGEIVLGRVDEAAEEGLEALATHIDSTNNSGEVTAAADGSGVTLRSIVAEEFDLVPERVEEYLRTTNSPVTVLNRSVEAIEKDGKKEPATDYGRIAFINRAYRYRLTEMAVELYKR